MNLIPGVNRASSKRKRRHRLATIAKATEAGIADHVWSIDEIVELLGKRDEEKAHYRIFSEFGNITILPV